MRYRTTLILIVIAAAAAVFFFFVEQPRHTRELERGAKKQRLEGPDPEDVSTVTIVRPDITIALQRVERGWDITQPSIDKADDSTVNTLVHAALGATIASRIESDPSDMAEYGLDIPAATIRLTANASGETAVIRVGDFSLTKTHCYATIGDDPGVVLLPAGVRRYALRALFEFRNRRVVEVSLDDVDRIGIASDKGSLVWTKDEVGDWFTVHDADTIAGDSTLVLNVIRRLRGLRAKNILYADPSDDEYVLRSIEGSISLSFGNDSLLVTFGDKNNDGCYVVTTESDRVVLVEPRILRVFEQTIMDYRNRHLLSFDRNEASKLTLDSSTRSITVSKDGTRWSFANPEYGNVDQEAVRTLVQRIEQLEFTRVIEDRLVTRTEFGFESPFVRLTIFDAEDRIVDRLDVGNPVEGVALRYVTSFSTDVLALIKATALADLEESFANLGAD